MDDRRIVVVFVDIVVAGTKVWETLKTPCQATFDLDNKYIDSCNSSKQRRIIGGGALANLAPPPKSEVLGIREAKAPRPPWCSAPPWIFVKLRPCLEIKYCESEIVVSIFVDKTIER